jgi:activator of 2-hydroxyglutaryl-CoA dehydratase
MTAANGTGTYEGVGARERLRGDELVIGVDVGSTTVKAVCVDPLSREILWSDYQRHETRQAEKVRELLVAIGNEFADLDPSQIRVFITGSGAMPLVKPLGARFVQEVNAVTLAVEALHPDVRRRPARVTSRPSAP